jgi:hypothetical protein
VFRQVTPDKWLLVVARREVGMISRQRVQAYIGTLQRYVCTVYRSGACMVFEQAEAENDGSVIVMI